MYEEKDVNFGKQTGPVNQVGEDNTLIGCSSASTAQAESSCNAFESHMCPKLLSRHIGTVGCLKISMKLADKCLAHSSVLFLQIHMT